MKVLVSDTSALVDLERGSLLDATIRLRRTGLPGHPDLVSPRRRLAMFVHGCFLLPAPTTTVICRPWWGHTRSWKETFGL